MFSRNLLQFLSVITEYGFLERKHLIQDLLLRLKCSFIMPGDKTEKVRFWVSPEETPYIKTKPLHGSQITVESNEDGSAVFELNVIVNRELVRLLFGYAEGLKVLSPRKLKWMMKKHFRQGLAIYETPNR